MLDQSNRDASVPLRSLVINASHYVSLDGYCGPTSVEFPEYLQQPRDTHMNTLLSKFAITFKENRGLPPTRNVSHSIPLLHGDGPLSLCPDRYPNYFRNRD